MFRFLSSLFLALAALFALRLIFATARRINQGDKSRRVDSPAPDARMGSAKGSRTPRIDSTLAEDVPFVEIGGEREERERERVTRD